MTSLSSHDRLDQALEHIEGTILPNIAVMLDNILEAAALAKPGANGDVYAFALRALAAQAENLTREMGNISPVGFGRELPKRVSAAG
jgi:hypothetical protein